MDQAQARTRVLDSAETLFYRRGIQAVGMDEVRAAAGVSLKRLYQCFGSKQALLEAYLQRRDQRWRAELAGHVAAHATGPREALLTVFDWLHAWFSQPGYRGCAFINSVGELGAVAADVGRTAQHHKQQLQQYLTGLARQLPVEDPDTVGRQLGLLIDGAITTAAITGDAAAARDARQAAAALIATATNASTPDRAR